MERRYTGRSAKVLRLGRPGVVGAGGAVDRRSGGTRGEYAFCTGRAGCDLWSGVKRGGAGVFCRRNGVEGILGSDAENGLVGSCNVEWNLDAGVVAPAVIQAGRYWGPRKGSNLGT